MASCFFSPAGLHQRHAAWVSVGLLVQRSAFRDSVRRKAGCGMRTTTRAGRLARDRPQHAMGRLEGGQAYGEQVADDFGPFEPKSSACRWPLSASAFRWPLSAFPPTLNPTIRHARPSPDRAPERRRGQPSSTHVGASFAFGVRMNPKHAARGSERPPVEARGPGPKRFAQVAQRSPCAGPPTSITTVPRPVIEAVGRGTRVSVRMRRISPGGSYVTFPFTR